MSTFECKNCGGELEIISDGIGKCTSCRSKQSITNKRKDEIASSYNRANGLRLKDCNFDDAMRAYENILRDNHDEAEAYWGIVLCRYGIEYVLDRGEYKPTCHRTIEKSIKDDEDFRMACEYATEDAKAYYIEQAELIDTIQTRILSIVSNEKPYDIFISYKERDDNTGEQTQDSKYANSLYTGLIKEGYNVFYAKETLKEKIGVEYEPYIYAALKSARVMILIGTKKEYFEATWVKNEWRRFKEMVKQDATKRIFVAYADIDAYDLPDEIRSIQAADMRDMTFFNDILSNINSFMKEIGESFEERNIKQISATLEKMGVNAGNSAITWIESGQALLENKKYDAACKDFEQAIAVNPKFGKAYWNRMLAKLKCSEDMLVHSAIDLYKDDDYIKAIKFSSAEEQKHMKHIAELCLNAYEIQNKYDYECDKLKKHYESTGSESNDEKLIRKTVIKEEIPRVEDKITKIDLSASIVMQMLSLIVSFLGILIIVDILVDYEISKKLGIGLSENTAVLLIFAVPIIVVFINTFSFIAAGICFGSYIGLFILLSIFAPKNEIIANGIIFLPFICTTIYSIASPIMTVMRKLNFKKLKSNHAKLNEEYAKLCEEIAEEFNTRCDELFTKYNNEKINKAYRIREYTDRVLEL